MFLSEYLDDMNVTKAEVAAYEKIKRQEYCWDVAAYLGWGLETHFIACEDAPHEIECQEDGATLVTEGEFNYMVGYIDEFFNVDSTIFNLEEEAFIHVTEMRRGNFQAVPEQARDIAKSTVMVEMRAARLARMTRTKNRETLDEFLFLIEDYYCPDCEKDPSSFYTAGEEEEMLSDLLSCQTAQTTGFCPPTYLELFREMGLKDSTELLEYLKGEMKRWGYPEAVYDNLLKEL